MSKKLTLVYDLDETLCTKKQPHETYADVKPIKEMIDQLNRFYDEGHEIVISTARHMVTCNGDIELVKQKVGQITIDWLQKHGVKYHKLIFGKPYGDCYCDDKSIRPKELLDLEKINGIDDLSDYLKNESSLPIINKSIKFLLHNTKYYVYQWFYFKDNEKIVFYVGKGSKFRAWDTKRRNEIFKNIYKTHKCDVEIVELFDSNSDAIQYATQLKYKYINLGYCEACLDDIRG